MKLYATITGAKLQDGKYIQVSKGQGSNKGIVSSFTVEQMGGTIEVVRVQMLYNKEQGYTVVVQLPGHQSTETRLELNEHNNLYSITERVRDNQKGEEQKDGINMCDHKQTVKTVHGRYCLDCHAYL